MSSAFTWVIVEHIIGRHIVAGKANDMIYEAVRLWDKTKNRISICKWYSFYTLINFKYLLFLFLAQHGINWNNPYRSNVNIPQASTVHWFNDLRFFFRHSFILFCYAQVKSNTLFELLIVITQAIAEYHRSMVKIKMNEFKIKTEHLYDEF